MFNGTCLCTACSSSAHRKLLFHRAAHLRAMTRSGRVKYLFHHKRFIANLNENHKLAAAPDAKNKYLLCSCISKVQRRQARFTSWGSILELF
jgi:hypothetical protein